MSFQVKGSWTSYEMNKKGEGKKRREVLGAKGGRDPKSIHKMQDVEGLFESTSRLGPDRSIIGFFTFTRLVALPLSREAAVKAFLREHGIGYPNLIDAPGPADAGVRLGNPAGVLPYTVLVSADGRILKTRIGPFVDPDDIRGWAERVGAFLGA